jgi:hypothetical protein
VRLGRPVPQKSFPGDDAARAGHYIAIGPIDVTAKKIAGIHSVEVCTRGFRLARDQAGYVFEEPAKARPLIEIDRHSWERSLAYYRMISLWCGSN